ncbi:phosphatidate cytidylyltransferase [Polaribacter huanghezhanensis]|uniref:phosphatidate cytidylyltransferase n=1 Tax=Polaribacter huanghezhanensis TaxID=1354726 RepID=UPI002649EC01|nr:phosphatidate cytidylyltransferase [Polaribacter huanghezhanensis]
MKIYKMSPLLTRSLSGIVYVTIFLSAVLFSKFTFIALVSIFAICCIFEFHKLILFKNVMPYIVFIGLTFFLVRNPTSKIIIPILALTLLASLQLIYRLYSKTKLQSSRLAEKLDISIRYIVFSFCLLILLPYQNGEYESLILISILILIWVNDSFAFLVGKNFGKNKLFQSVSPKKTIEGFIGGVLFSIIASVIIAYKTELYSVLDWVIIALITSIIGSIGDLVESNFKRHAAVKDSGNIMPGHGGLLDRLDSLIFAIPFLYLYIHYII